MSVLLCAAFVAAATTQSGGIDLKLAAQYFSEAQAISELDNGELWGKKLYGPMLFVDPGTGELVANQPDKEGKLQKQGDVYVGKAPENMGFANTATDFSGYRWTMMLWPLSPMYVDRAGLMMHESFHRIQDDVGLPGTIVENSHLDTMNGRIWLRLELRALSAALTSFSDDKKQEISDALLFRAYRQSLFTASKTSEDRMEMHEGMAEYTGQSLRGSWPPESRQHMGAVDFEPGRPTFAKSFAYLTGPSYGLLLDLYRKDWRKDAKPTSSLADMLQDALKITLPKDIKAAADARAKNYDGVRIMQEEAAKEKERQALMAKFKQALVDGPVLEIPSSGLNYTYNPNKVYQLEGYGTVYLQPRFTGDWGVLDADGPVLLTTDRKGVYVAAPSSTSLMQGPDWKLQLNPGWKIIPGKRPGDFIIVKD